MRCESIEPGDDQAIDRPRHRDVIEAQPLGLLLGPAGVLDVLVAEHAVPLPRHRVGDPEAEAAVGKAEDLVGRRCVPVPTGVRDDDHLELEPLRSVDREQAHGIRALLHGDRVTLGRSDRLLLFDEANEALEIRAAQLLVRARDPRQLAQICIPPPPVPLGEYGEVVVVVGDDPLAESFEGKARRGLDQPVVALPERAQEPDIALVEIRRERALEPGEDRPARGPPDQQQRVVRHADEGRREHRHECFVVVAILKQAEIREQVDHLLLAEVAAAGCPVRRQTGLAQLLLVPLGIGTGGKEQDDLTCARGPRVDELLHTPGYVPRLGAAPVDTGVGVRGLVGHEQLDRDPEHRVGELA